MHKQLFCLCIFFRVFVQKKTPRYNGNEPEDHFGTVLLLAAWLCETEQDALFAQLLAWHLLPWSGRFLSVFVDHAAHPFYQALGQLAQATLAQWQENLPIAVAQKPLYR